MATTTITNPESCITRIRNILSIRRRDVLVGVSGGADSMALMHAAARTLGGHVQVVHVHHGLRRGAEEDAAFVEAAAARLDLPFHRVDAPPGPGDEARTETAARKRRMAAFTRKARSLGSPYVLLAHHLDDEIETMLLHRERGHTGPRARAGIPTVRALAPLEGRRGPFLVRPFCLGEDAASRDDLRRYAVSLSLSHVEDETNADLTVARNRIRAALTDDERAALIDARRVARARVAELVTAARQRLSLHLRAEGLGSRLDRAALAGDDEDRAELLRLLGGCLAQARRLDPRATLLRHLRDPPERGQLLLPAAPRPVMARFSRAGIHFPDEPLVPGSDAIRAYRASLAISRYL